MSFRVHILPQLGSHRLNKIGREDMEEFVALLVGKKLAKDSIRLILAALGVLFREAIEHGIVTENPAQRLGKYYRNAPTINAEIQPLAPHEVQLFLKAVMVRSPQHLRLSPGGDPHRHALG